MPLYEYECEPNGHRFEVIRKFSDPPLEACRICGGPVRKLFSSPAIQFKGSGWYITDYARAGKSDTAEGSGKKSDKGEKSEKSDSGSGGESGKGTSTESTGSSGDSKAGGEKSTSETKSTDSKPAAPSKPAS